jgi:hypothetical protein
LFLLHQMRCPTSRCTSHHFPFWPLLTFFELDVRCAAQLQRTWDCSIWPKVILSFLLISQMCVFCFLALHKHVVFVCFVLHTIKDLSGHNPAGSIT